MDDVGQALLRAFFVGACASLIAGRFAAVFQRGNRSQFWLGLLVFLPWVTPPLLVSYGYRIQILRWIHYPLLQEVFYLMLLFVKVVPLGVLIRSYFYLRPTSTSQHVARLAGVDSWGFRLRSVDLSFWLASLAGFFLVFNEFEIVAGFGLASWTVALFDGQVGGMMLSESFRLAWVPLILQLGVACLLLLLVRSCRRKSCTVPERSGGWGLWVYAFAALFLGVLIPLGNIAMDAVKGMKQLLPFVIGKDLVASLGLAAAVAATDWLSSRYRWSWLLAFGGLLGGLLTGLCLVALFQISFLRALYDTPLPLLLALTLLGLPFAILLRWVRFRYEASTPAHVARLSGQPVLLWRYFGAPRFWMFVFLFWLAYVELSASSILVPSGMPLIFLRLHNLTHYGQTHVLSAMLLVSTVLPLLLLMVGMLGHYLFLRFRFYLETYHLRKRI